MSTIATKKNKSKKAAKSTEAKAVFRDCDVSSVAEDMRGLVSILHKGLAMLKNADDVPAYLADATVIIGDTMINLAAIDAKLRAKHYVEAETIKPYIDVKELVSMEMDALAYLHDARRKLDTMLYNADAAFGLATHWDLSTPENRKIAANSTRDAFVGVLRGIELAESTIENFRKDLQKNGGAE